MKISKLDALRNYEIRIEFKRIKNDIQMLVFMNNELKFSSKKNSFKIESRKDHKIKLNKWKLPYYESFDKKVVLWENTKEQNRFLNFCRQYKYKTCMNLQEELIMQMSDFNKLDIA